MATEIDELIVQISADTRGLKQELSRVKGQIDKAFPQGGASPVGKFGVALRGLLGPLAAVGSALVALSLIHI